MGAQQAVGGSEPDVTVPLPFPGWDAKLRIEDFDGGGRSDVVVTGRDANKRLQIFFLRPK